MRDVRPPPQLLLQSVTKSFGALRVVDRIDLSVRGGSICGLIGPNGAGKSTLFALATGILAVDSGAVIFEGQDITRLSPVARARLGLARTFQVPREFRHLSLRQNLMVAKPDQAGEHLLNVFLRPSRVKKEEAELSIEVDNLISFFGLQRVRDEAAGRLSGGQKKLLELGRALMLKPRLVLLDEPFAGVNPVMLKEICGKILALRQRGTSFLIVEHNLSALASIADTLYVVDRGQMIGEGTPQSVLQDAKVRDAYLGGALAAC
jgi:branched-chain amino acid transport system ATP-binding protein